MSILKQALSSMSSMSALRECMHDRLTEGGPGILAAVQPDGRTETASYDEREFMRLIRSYYDSEGVQLRSFNAEAQQVQPLDLKSQFPTWALFNAFLQSKTLQHVAGPYTVDGLLSLSEVGLHMVCAGILKARFVDDTAPHFAITHQTLPEIDNS